MKYILGLLGLFLTYTCAWAAPEAMTMYATLSAPIASFWEVKTERCEPVTMPANSQLNLGTVQYCTDNACNATRAASTGGTITLQGKPFEISNLYMEKNTSLQIGSSAKWMVDTINIAPGANVTVAGGLIVNTLNLTSQTTSPKTITLTIGSNLRLDNNVSAPYGEFKKITSTGFNFNVGSEPVKQVSWGQVNCTKHEPGCPKTYLLVGGSGI